MVNLVDDARLAVRLARNSLPADDGKRAGRIRSPTNVASKSLTSGRPAFRGAALETAMMDSIGHDLRGSLTVILGTVTTLLEYRSSLDEAVQGDLLEAIKEEVVRLNRYVAEILDQRRRCGDSRAAHIEATDIKGLALALRKALHGLRGHELLSSMLHASSAWHRRSGPIGASADQCARECSWLRSRRVTD